MIRMYDVIVVGAGAAGLTAAVYTCRKKLKTLVISFDLGGQTNLTSNIENYPGVEPMHGNELMLKFEKNAKSFGAELVYGKVVRIEKKDKDFSVILSNGEVYETKTVILAFGKVPKTLCIPGEEKFLGRGISTSAVYDSHFYHGKKVAVVGGGNSALEAVIELAKTAVKVYLIHRREEFRADGVIIDKIKRLKNAEIILNTVAKEVKGDNRLKSLCVENLKNGEHKELEIEGIFIEIGFMIDASMVKDLVKLNERGEIIIDDRCNTSCPGIFAAGDSTTVPFKQTVISAGEGAKAGLEAYRYLTGGKGVTIDWTH